MPKYYSPAEKQSILEEFKLSGLSKAKFAKIKNIGESSLFKWAKEFAQFKANTKTNFIPVNLEGYPHQNQCKENKSFILKLHNNIEIEFPHDFDLNNFSKLLKELIK